MFTGIVEEIGTVESLRQGRLSVKATKALEGAKLGNSVSVNGACLTIVTLGKRSLSVEIMPETLSRTNLGALRVGDRVNLERALSFGGPVGGHLVQGHVDATGTIASLTPQGSAVVVNVVAPEGVMKYVVEKGFIAVDGVSLTVIGCDVQSFDVSLVGYTLQHTNLGGKHSGDLVNLEADIIAKYVERLLPSSGKSEVTLDLLAESGFLNTRGGRHGIG
jgi:riboflavin synthase